MTFAQHCSMTRARNLVIGKSVSARELSRVRNCIKTMEIEDAGAMNFPAAAI